MSKSKPPVKSNNPSQDPAPPTRFAVARESRTIFDPEIVKRYSELVPDAPNRILTVFEKNAETERMVALQPMLENKRRDWMGFSLTVLLMVGAIVFAWLDKPYLYYPSLGLFIAIIGKRIFKK